MRGERSEPDETVNADATRANAPSPVTPGEPAVADRPPRVTPFVVLAIVLAVLLFFGLRYLVEAFTHESTDDAFIEGNIVAISPKVAGLVAAVHVHDNQPVKPGDALVDIDARDYQTTLAKKRAALQAAQSNKQSAQAAFELMLARLNTAEASAKQAESQAAASSAIATRAETDFKRADELLKQGANSPQEFDQAHAAALSARANANADRDKATSEKSKVAEAHAQVEATRATLGMVEAQIQQAQADLQEAELNLGYTHIVAPVDGAVTRKAVHVGEYVQVGQRLLAIVPSDIWVVANFKETQLTHLRTNQVVELRVDAYPDTPLVGHVDSVQAGSGARFSLLPPENAVGNYVKVVQRVPVKILFDTPLDGAHKLGPGMSVVPSVRINQFTVAPLLVGLAAGGLAILLAALGRTVVRRRPTNSTKPSG